MATLGTLLSAFSVARDASGALSAAHQALADGKPLGAAIDAFAAASDNQLDDAAVAELHRLAGTVLEWTATGATAAVAVLRWLEEHDTDIQHVAQMAADSCRTLAAVVEQAPWYAGVLARYAEHAALVACKVQTKIEALQ